MNAPVPFAPGALREFLIGNPDFTVLVDAANVTTRELPDPLRSPCVTIRVPGNVGVDPMLRRPMLVINAWVPPVKITKSPLDPDEEAWNIAALAGQLIGRARNVRFRESVWSGEWKTGPVVPDPDVKRGVDSPLYRAFIAVELKLREKPAR
ncbi:hypothetical protein DW322_11285 [Rhodococcus rhodnii]|uniref:Tail terminator n=2 Tax=Rhodococcus rhodnii TaxID=38312 RepID=R7WVB8_9NOCA|nr:hypothetical protein [Rhodococcus rhodnii]EOM78099.1 hypothetical protein Rrhod_0549 [Rhodococcus rhodnii LMG 5362]TXG90694.1 hypothetical protein DW322_11285 [Rhodococcus rhodnii]